MENIYAIIIFEILGRPAEYIKESLSQLIDKIKDEKGCKIEEKRVFEPKLVENQKDIFTTFAEVEIIFEKFEDLLRIIFNYMPSHIDIVRPQNSAFTNLEANHLVNELAIALHRYDEVAKRMMIENDALRRYIESQKQTAQVVARSIQENKEEKEAVIEVKNKRKYTRKKKEIKEEKEEQKTEVKEEKSSEEGTSEEKEKNQEENDIKNIGEDPEKIYTPKMTQEEEEYLDDIEEVIDEEEEK